jgi:hypothetical protein
MNSIRVRKEHEWISVIFGRHRLTVSYSGFKGSGAVPVELFDLFVAAMDGKADALAKIGAPSAKSKGEIADAFAKAIPAMWPDWDNKALYVPAVKDRVKANFGKRKGDDVGTVLGVKRNYADVQWDRFGRISVQLDMLAPAV